MVIKTIALAASAFAIAGLVAYAQPKPVSSRRNVAVVYKTPTVIPRR